MQRFSSRPDKPLLSLLLSTSFSISGKNSNNISFCSFFGNNHLDSFSKWCHRQHHQLCWYHCPDPSFKSRSCAYLSTCPPFLCEGGADPDNWSKARVTHVPICFPGGLTVEDESGFVFALFVVICGMG